MPEAICSCLQTCYVDVMLLRMDCVSILTFVIVTLFVVYTKGMAKSNQADAGSVTCLTEVSHV